MPWGDRQHDGRGRSARALVVALGLLVAFMAFEVIAAIAAHSLVLLADAGHMLVDVGAIAGSLVAIRLATRPETRSHTYGMKRAEILAAAGNAIALIVVSAMVAFEAVSRLLHPTPVDGAVLIWVAAVGVAVNVAATATLARANRRSLNIEGAFRHILTDLYGFVGTMVAGIIIVATGFSRADPLASLVVVALMLKAAVQLLGPAVHILLEATPEDIDLDEVRRHLVGAARGALGPRPPRVDAHLVPAHVHGGRRRQRRVLQQRRGGQSARPLAELPRGTL